jgi:Ion transport protein
MKLLKNKTFDQFILFVIVLSSAKLAVETYYLDEPSETFGVQVLNDFDYALSFVFTVEAIMKIIALGLIFD